MMGRAKQKASLKGTSMFTLLEETDKSISEIAGIVGYDNSSKFAKVFKDKMGCTPTEYKKQKVHLEHQRLFGVEIKQ